MMHPAAPLDLDEVLSPTWLDAVLAPTYPGARVASTTVVEELTTIASKVRFRVEYEPGCDAGAPTALCVKGYFAPQSRAMASLGQIEARFYDEVAPRLGVLVPTCVLSAIDAETGHGLILMTDLVAEGASFLTALSPYTVDQAAATLGQLARLHVTDPNQLGLTESAWLDPRLAGYLGYVSAERLQEQLDDGRGGALAAETLRADRVRTAFTTIAERAGSSAACLVHGDAHAGNLFVAADGSPGLIDWQVVQRGSWEVDVAYHLAAVLDVADREANEVALLDHYLDAVRSHGGEPPSRSDAWDAYRDALVYGYFMWAITSRVERPVIDTFVTRLGSAVEMHDSLARLGA
jgi:aminoglycoside phosphotransferase (APT) family kinase protein